MSKELVIRVYCDGDHGEKVVEGSPQRIRINDLEQEVDMCPSCEVELVTPLATFIAKHGQPVGTKPTEPKPEKCPVCGHGTKTRPGIVYHLRAKHGLKADGVTPLTDMADADA